MLMVLLCVLGFPRSGMSHPALTCFYELSGQAGNLQSLPFHNARLGPGPQTTQKPRHPPLSFLLTYVSSFDGGQADRSPVISTLLA